MKYSKLNIIVLLLFGILSSMLSVAAADETTSNTTGNINNAETAESTEEQQNVTKIKLVVEKGIDSTNSEIGDLLVSRVVDNVMDESGLIIPKGSWLIGHVAAVKRPSIFSQGGEISLRLDHLITVWGEMIPLDSGISFSNGQVVYKGYMKADSKFMNKALKPTHKLWDSKFGRTLSIATLGLPLATTFIGGSIVAIVKQGDDTGLQKGENFEIHYKY